MSAPQMKDRPASMLRAMFAGFGSLMSVMDKVRSKPAAEAPAATAAPAPEDTATSEATAAPADNATPESVADTTAEPKTSAEPVTVAAEAPAQPETSAAQETSAVTETSAASETTDDSAASSALPLANYDELSVASLRARLRNLSNDDLTQLMTYERAHQDRPEVVKMFQNRLMKMTSGLPKLEA
jgi:cytoskeletal protein RodZ